MPEPRPRTSTQQSRSKSPLCPSSVEDEPLLWVCNLLAQVKELKVATNCRRDFSIVLGEASDMDTELDRTAHKDQYIFKKVTSVFKAIKEKPSKAVEFAEKGEELLRDRNRIIRIVDSKGWDTAKFLLPETTGQHGRRKKRRLKEARDLVGAKG